MISKNSSRILGDRKCKTAEGAFSISPKNLELLKKQHYRVAGKHSVVQVCRWTKNSLIGKGECYKHKFYGIPSWKCCEMSPSAVWCDNQCLHCWRTMEATQGTKINPKLVDNPKVIIEECIKHRKKLLTGFGGHGRVSKEKYKDAQEPAHFAISLIGEPTLYPKIGEIIALLRKQGKTSFIVTNGLHPDMLKKLEKKKQLPTQLYLSLNSSNEKEYLAWHKSVHKDAWKRYNQTLDFMNKITKKGKRTVLRMTLVKNMNMDDRHVAEFAELIKKSGALFVEAKSFMSLGSSRQRLAYETMPSLKEMEVFSKKLAKALGMKILDRHAASRIFLIGKPASRKRMKITKSEI